MDRAQWTHASPSPHIFAVIARLLDIPRLVLPAVRDLGAQAQPKGHLNFASLYQAHRDTAQSAHERQSDITLQMSCTFGQVSVVKAHAEDCQEILQGRAGRDTKRHFITRAKAGGRDPASPTEVEKTFLRKRKGVSGEQSKQKEQPQSILASARGCGFLSLAPVLFSQGSVPRNFPRSCRC